MSAPRTEEDGKQALAFGNFRRIIRDTHVKTESFHHPDDGPAPCFHHAENTENDTAIHQRMVFFSFGTLFLIIRSSFSYVSLGTHKTPAASGSVRYLLNHDTSPHVCPVEKCLFCVVWCESEMHSHRVAVLRTRDSRDILQITEVLQ